MLVYNYFHNIECKMSSSTQVNIFALTNICLGHIELFDNNQNIRLLSQMCYLLLLQVPSHASLFHCMCV